MKAEKISVAKGSEKTLLLEANCSAAYSISLAEGAKAEVVIVNAAPVDDDVEISVDVKIGKNAALKLVGCTLGGRETKSEMKIVQKTGSRCEHFEVALLSGAQRLIARTQHLHCEPRSFSRSSFRYAAAGCSQVNVQGNVEIAQKAARADAHFMAKSLLLSREARVRVVPMLSVKTGDVTAGHGAAMAPVSADELFYLESRGIEEKAGKHMILEGFLLESVANAKLDRKLAGGLEKCLAQKIGVLDGF